jgi:molybdopterin converting factor small subunit
MIDLIPALKKIARLSRKGNRGAMFRCIVEMFGLSDEITGLRKVEVELKDGASPRDVIAALRREIPALEGPIIRCGENQLVDHYGFYINGRFYAGDEEVQLKDGDRIVLLALASGG